MAFGCLNVSRHGNKLKPGHLHGNRFRILVREVVAEAGERLPPLLERLRREGLANFYGEQRFGRDGRDGAARSGAVAAGAAARRQGERHAVRFCASSPCRRRSRRCSTTTWPAAWPKVACAACCPAT